MIDLRFNLRVTSYFCNVKNIDIIQATNSYKSPQERFKTQCENNISTIGKKKNSTLSNLIQLYLEDTCILLYSTV